MQVAIICKRQLKEMADQSISIPIKAHIRSLYSPVLAVGVVHMDGILQTIEDELWVDTTFHMVMACISAHPLFYSALINGPSHKHLILLVVRCGYFNCSNFI